MKKITLLLTFTNILFANILFYPRIIYLDTTKNQIDILLKNNFPITQKISLALENPKKDNGKNYCDNLKLSNNNFSLISDEHIEVTIYIEAKEKHNFKEYYCNLTASNSINDEKTMVPIIIRATTNPKLKIKVTSYGYKIKDGNLFHRVDIQNNSDFEIRGITLLEFWKDMNNLKEGESYQYLYIPSHSSKSVFNKLDISKNEFVDYTGKVFLADEPDKPLQYRLFDYRNNLIDEFKLKLVEKKDVKDEPKDDTSILDKDDIIFQSGGKIINRINTTY